MTIFTYFITICLVPCLEKSFITLEIKINDLVKVLIHFAKSMPVLFFYTNVATGLKIRDLLGMQDPKGPYFDPASKGTNMLQLLNQWLERYFYIKTHIHLYILFLYLDHTHKRITLLPEKISDESKAILKDLYKPIFEELNSKEANDILVKASPKTVCIV
jgi:sentrin-specific protease 7